ncbi:hypothetical protein FRIGORI9N_70078 [Frigoribacterium sp. 9N]|nr:hypothetical protein FRIGORI9N_70078 [Frigoribacterium sp. 9N]
MLRNDATVSASSSGSLLPKESSRSVMLSMILHAWPFWAFPLVFSWLTLGWLERNVR